MSPLLFTLLPAAFLVLLYAFVARAVRWVVRDVRNASPGGPAPVEAAVMAPAVGPPVARTVALPRTARRGGTAGEAGRPRREAPPRVSRWTVLGIASAAGRRDGRDRRPYLSDAHAQVYRDGEEWMLTDAGSTDGTYLNPARPAVPTPLHPGDQVAIGRTVIEVHK